MTIGLGILSWGAHKTLRHSLESHRNGELFSLFDDAFIFFNEITAEDRAIAAEFGLRAEGGSENFGIMGGMKKIAEILKTDYVVNLENDLSFISDQETARQQIAAAVEYLKIGKMQCCRIDDRKIGNDGELKRYSRCYPVASLNQKDTFARKVRRFLHPARAQRRIGTAVYAEEKPHQIFPNYISQLDENFWQVDSSAIDWTNRVPLYPRRWFLEEIIPFAENNPSPRTVNKKPDLEGELNCHWWGKQHYKIGVCKNGLFAHERLDRPQEDEKGL